MEVDSDGTITANGETITKVMIDGKEFFLDDPQLATKNIPAKIIEKVKVVEKKSDQAEFTGIDDGDEETVRWREEVTTSGRKVIILRKILGTRTDGVTRER